MFISICFVSLVLFLFLLGWVCCFFFGGGGVYNIIPLVLNLDHQIKVFCNKLMDSF
jgi:hypothetical protein